MFRRGKKENKAKLEHKLYLARENPEPIFDLSECDVKQVPSGIYSLCKVFLKEQLNLAFNQLSSLHGGGSLQDLQNLSVLALNNNQFTQLPDDIHFLRNLKELYVHNNQLKKLPPTICHLKQLRVCNLNDNALQELPASWGYLHQLRTLHVRNNARLRALPASMYQMQHLQQIDADAEQFVYPPADVMRDGCEAIMRFICADNSCEYTPRNDEDGEEVHQLDGGGGDPYSNIEAKVMELENIKAKKLQEFLAIERHNELMQRQEMEQSLKMKQNKEKLLEDIYIQNLKLDASLEKVQRIKDMERFSLIEQLKEVEENSDAAVNQLLKLNRQPLAQILEREQIEQEKLLAAANAHNDAINKAHVLLAMETMLANETQRFRELVRYRQETSQNILAEESAMDSHLLAVFKLQDDRNRQLAQELLGDDALQKAAVAALLEQSDARAWSLVQQVKMVEAQLAALTTIEMDRRKLEIDEQLNDLSEKRINLSILLMDLLEQQSARRAQLLDTLRSLELENAANADDFWLRQYQQLLDRMPDGLAEYQRNISPHLCEALLMRGVLSYLPFLAKWSQNENKLIYITDEDLAELGVRSEHDRAAILDAFATHKLHYAAPRPQMEEPTAPSPTLDEAAASAPPQSPPPHDAAASPPNVGGAEVECVVCMDQKCEMIYIPCGHYCCCTNCSSNLVECPMCRGPIQRMIRID